MKRSMNIIIDDKVAEAINLHKFDKFDSQNEKNKINHSMDFPILISKTHNIIESLLLEGELKDPIFNNVVENERQFASLYLEDESKKYYTNTLVTEISNSHNFDFERKIDVFTPSVVEKIAQFFKNKYKHMINNPTPYQLEVLANRHNMPYKDLDWAFKKIHEEGVDEYIYSIIDLKFESKATGASINLNPTKPKAKKLLKIISKLLVMESTDFEEYYFYFKRIFSDLYIEIHPISPKSTNLLNEQKEIHISYLKLLAMRVFEYFDVFKDISVDINQINKLSMLLLQIQDEINFLESDLMGA